MNLVPLTPHPDYPHLCLAFEADVLTRDHRWIGSRYQRDDGSWVVILITDTVVGLHEHLSYDEAMRRVDAWAQRNNTPRWWAGREQRVDDHFRTLRALVRKHEESCCVQ